MSTARPGPGHDEGFEELAVGWALHALEPEDADAFLPHLSGCPRCREIVDQTTEVMGDLATAAPAVELPPGLGERLRAEVARTPQDVPAERPEQAAAPAPARPAPAAASPAVPSRVPAGVPVPRRRWTSVLVAAAVAAVVGLGAWTAVLIGDRDEARDAVAAESALVEELLRPGPATVVPVTDDGRTVATLLTRDDGVQVVSHALEPNDRDAEIYVLWGLEQGTPKALGEFDVDGPGLELRTLEVEGADDFPSYGISVEPGRQAPEAPTDVVARS
ncbi:anti-sigma factor [Blastococcus sp. TF02-09]|uniref:anti-sigma factor n=1 Tax=Blastococcus sp. TF02-09 TaxID=2250576 RepID=UPI000DEBFB7E|nr:anti-sigma factor [Blastococcus sp. TF02-9]RBY81211.1 anti-sigma factor [Blastococcus sp. TF02-9]